MLISLSLYYVIKFCKELTLYRIIQEGYGKFGGKDYYVLLEEMNNKYDDNVKRDDGIEISFNSHDENTLYPNLIDSLKWKWINKAPKDCPNQGFFY